jgi:hypothetical protein
MSVGNMNSALAQAGQQQASSNLANSSNPAQGKREFQSFARKGKLVFTLIKLIVLGLFIFGVFYFGGS